MSTGERLAAFGLALPEGHTLVSLEDRPNLRRAIGRLSSSVWPEFMHHDEVADAHWAHLHEDFASMQCGLFDPAGRLVAVLRCAPVAWDGTDEGLPDGWDDQFLRTMAGLAPGARPADTLGALLIAVRKDRRGSGYAGVMVSAMQAIARSHGHRSLIACVRPTGKEPYALIPIERYATWTRSDGLPVDPWIRLHVRLGGRVVRGAPQSMTIRGTVAEWREWTGLSMPESGEYLPAGAMAPVSLDVAADSGVYHDPSVWVVHEIA